MEAQAESTFVGATAGRAELRRHLQRFDLVLLAVVAGLAAASVVVVVLGVQFSTAGLDLVINTVTAVAGAAAAALAWTRYKTESDLAGAYESAAFVVLFGTRALLVVLALTGLQGSLGLSIDSPHQWPIYAWTVARFATAALLVVAATIEVHPRARLATRTGAAAAALAILAVAFLFIVLPAFEGALSGVVVTSIISVPGSAPRGVAAMVPAAVIVQAVVAGIYLWGASLYRRLYRERGRRYTAFLSLALLIAAFSQLHWAILPGIYAPVVTADDVLRAGMSIVLLIGIEEQSREDLGRIRAANAELEVRRTAEIERGAREAAIARDIHDGIAQELWLVKLKLSRLATAPDAGPEAAALTDESVVAVDRALEQARAAVATIRASGGTSPLSETLAETTAEFAEQSGIRVEVSGELPEAPPRVAAEIVRIVQEALTNVHKHADATVVRITVAEEEHDTVLTIADNGRGFAPGQASGTGYGIRGMRERAALIGGELTINSRPQGGSRVVLIVPRDEP